MFAQETVARDAKSDIGKVFTGDVTLILRTEWIPAPTKEGVVAHL